MAISSPPGPAPARRLGVRWECDFCGSHCYRAGACPNCHHGALRPLLSSSAPPMLPEPAPRETDFVWPHRRAGDWLT